MNTVDREKTCMPLLSEVPMFRDLGEEPRRFIAGDCYQRTAPKGLVLCEKGSIPNGFFYLADGRVKLAVLSKDGGERVIDIVLPGSTFAESAAFHSQPLPMFVETLCEARLLFIGRDRVREAVTRWPEVGLALLHILSQRVHDLTQDLEACCLHTARQRVGNFLLREAGNGAFESDCAEVILPAAKVVIASSLNLTAETFSRELHSLVRDKVIRIDRRTIQIQSLDRLRCRCAA